MIGDAGNRAAASHAGQIRVHRACGAPEARCAASETLNGALGARTKKSAAGSISNSAFPGH
jgi:hypothetical protein